METNNGTQQNYLALMKEMLTNSKNFKNEDVLLYINELIQKLDDLKTKKSSYPIEKQIEMENLKKNLKVIVQNIQQATLFANDKEFMNNFEQSFQNTIAKLNSDCESLKNQKQLLIKDMENLARMKKNNAMQYIEINDRFDITKQLNNSSKFLYFLDFLDAITYSINKCSHRLIIQPKPTWLTHEDLWESGFGAFWDMAHENQNKQFVLIIQNYNLALADCYGQHLWNAISGYIKFMPLSKFSNKGIPNNLFIFLTPIRSKNNELALSESQYVTNIIQKYFENVRKEDDAWIYSKIWNKI